MDKYPEIHKFFPEGRPTELTFIMMHSYIEVDGEKLYMSPEIEDFFASGKNFEHSDGSVHQTKLERYFQVRKYWKTFVIEYKEANKSAVSDD